MVFVIRSALAIVGLWLLLCNPVTAAAAFVPNESVQSTNLAPYLELLEDPTQQLTLTQVSSAAYAPRFITNTAAVPDIGHTRSAWWARFQIRADTPQAWYLLLDRPIGGSIEAFVLPAEAKTRLHRLEDYRFPAYQLPLAAGETVSVYLRINNGKALLTLPLKLLTAEQLLSNSNTETLVFTALFAGMLVLALYNLLIFFSLRDYSYLSLVGFICTTGLMFFRDSHLFPTIVWLGDTQHYFYIAPLILAIATAFQYWGHVNQGGSPLLARLCQWIPPLMLAIIPFIGLLPSVETLFFGFALALVPVLIVLVSSVALSGHRSTRNIYWAALILLFGLTPYAIVHVGWLTYDRLIAYFGQSSVLLAMLLLSFAQAQQTRWLREENSRIEAASQAKDTFLTTMSHELRTPIHAVVGVANLLRRTALSSEQAAHLDKLSASSRHLQALVDDVLDLSRIGAGKLALDITTFRLEEILDNLQQMFSSPAAQKGLVLSITHTLPAGLWVRGDPLRLKQVLVNVLGNALKFTANGRIAVVVQQVEECRDGYICLYFAVEDTGIGISHAQRQYLFQPFSQADNSTVRRYGGSGLGLAISRKLVRLMGGELALVSEPNQGSRFFFTLAFPRQTPTVVEASPASDSSAPPQKLAGLEVLLVDDDALNRYLGHAMLEILGVKATVVDSGQAAIQQVQQRAFDLVMMDVSMPEMDGYTTTRHIRTAGYTALPIIAVTAHAIEGEYGRCINAGMNDYLRKPFDLETLHLIILHNLTVAPSQLEYK